MLKFGVLGPVTAHRAGLPADLRTAMLQRLMAILLCRPAQPMPVDSLSEALWDGEPPASARKTLQVYVHRLRRALGGDRVPRSPTGYALTVQPGELDALIFAELTEQAAAQGDPARASELLSKALGLWRGDAFADITCCRYVTQHAQLLEEQRLHTLDQFASLELSLGRHSQLIGALTAACAANPYVETLRGHLMLALYRNGRQAEALAEYRQLHQQMVDDLGVEPGSDLQRLHERILRSDPELNHTIQTSVTTTTGPVRPAQLPLDIRSFTGRLAQLKELDSILPLARTTVVTITGTAGVGKTTTAVHWAHQVADRFPDGQLYVNLRGFDPSAMVTSPAEALRGFLTALGIAPERIPAELEARTAMFRSLLADKQMLVVLDNALDAEHVRPLLPGSGGCLVVVTSRNQLAGLVVAEGAHPVPLDLLTDDESRQLLCGRLGARADLEPGAVSQMISRCARLPLALAVFAATAILRPQTSLASLITDLDAAKSGLDTLSGDDPLTDVRAVFSWSYKALDPQTARVFRLLAIHPGPEIGSATAADLAGISLERVATALSELAGAHLLTADSLDRFGMHDLLRAYANELLEAVESDANRKTARERMLDHYLHTAYAAARVLGPHRLPIPMPPKPNDLELNDVGSYGAAQAWLSAELPALCHIQDLAAESGLDEHVWRLGWALGDFVTRQARWSTLEAIQHASLASAEKLANPYGKGYAYRYLAVGDYGQGKLIDSERQHLRALATFAEAKLIAEQGLVCLDLGAFHERTPALSLRYSQQALEFYAQAGHRVGGANALNGIGMAYLTMGDHSESIVYAERALETMLTVGDHYGAAAAWATVGVALQHLGEHDRAISSLQNSIDLYRHVGRRQYLADILVQAGDAYLAAGRESEAQKAWQEARTIDDELGVVHDDLSRKLQELNEAKPSSST